MSISFSRSLRALQTDSFRPTALGLLIVFILFTAWGAWFFGAQIALYQVSDTVILNQPKQAMAQFPPDALGHIQIGQTAYLRLNGYPWIQYGLLSATVNSVVYNPNQKLVNVNLTLHPTPNNTIPLQQGMAGTIQIQTEHLSPATLLLRTIGYRLTLSTPPPQKASQ